MNYENWKPYPMYCLNCGELIFGFRNDEGVVKGECKRCGTVFVRRFRSRRHESIDVFAPKGTERVYV